jgi:hypothetical protein
MKGGISHREKGLLIAAAVVMSLAFYATLRIKPQKAFYKAFEEEVASLEQQINTTRLPPVTGEDETLKKELETLEAQLKQANSAFDTLFKNRVDANSDQALEGLMLKVLALANAQGVIVDMSGVYTGSVADFGIVSKEELGKLQASGAPLRFRPLRHLALRGDYARIQRFIRELPGLDHEVTVLRFAFKTDPDKAGSSRNGTTRVLRAELVLAL